MTNQLFTRENVTFQKEAGKWQFQADTFCLIVSGKASKDKADKIAGAINASMKRGFVSGSGDIDAMARGQIRKIVAMKTYKGIDFTPGY